MYSVKTFSSIAIASSMSLCPVPRLSREMAPARLRGLLARCWPGSACDHAHQVGLGLLLRLTAAEQDLAGLRFYFVYELVAYTGKFRFDIHYLTKNLLDLHQLLTN